MSSSNNQKMEKLLSTYKEHLLLYKTELEADWQAAQHDTKRVQHIMSMAHKLSGSGKAYGFVELSQLARELDHACDMAKNMPPKELISSLTRPIDDLLSALERANEIKHPIAMQKHIDELDALLADVSSLAGKQVCLQPISQQPRATQLAVQTCIARNWRLSLQTHKYIGIE